MTSFWNSYFRCLKAINIWYEKNFNLVFFKCTKFNIYVSTMQAIKKNWLYKQNDILSGPNFKSAYNINFFGIRNYVNNI